jgi:hypothetical protein
MRVLCCLDGTNVGQVSKATEMLSTNQPLILGILYVTDTGPRRDIEHTRERFCGGPARQGRAPTKYSRQSTPPLRIS